MTKKGRLLLVDDNETFLEHCMLWFEENFDVQAVTTGEDAIALIAKKQYDVLITDYKLPGMTGIELIQQAKKIKPGLHSLVITDYPSVKVASKGIDLGISAYMEKDNFKTDTFKDTKFIKKDVGLDLKSLETVVCNMLEKNVNRKIVLLMNKALLLWNRSIDKRNMFSKYYHKADFAEKSGLWKVQDQNDIKRTRGLDRYLEINKLPNNPNTDLIIRSVTFVLDNCNPKNNDSQEELRDLLHEFESLIWA